MTAFLSFNQNLPDGAGPGTATEVVYLYDGLREERDNAGDHVLLALGWVRRHR